MTKHILFASALLLLCVATGKAQFSSSTINATNTQLRSGYSTPDTLLPGQIEEREYKIDSSAMIREDGSKVLDAPKSSDGYEMFLGATILGKGSVKTAVAEGTKTAVTFNNTPDINASIFLPFGVKTNLGFGLDIGLTNLAYGLKPESGANDENALTERYQYIGVFPHVNLGGFIAGINFGFAQSGSARFLNGDTASVVGTFRVDTNRANNTVTTTHFADSPFMPNYDPAKYLASLIELRLGGAITVLNSKTGKLNFIIMAGYSLNGLFTDERNYAGAYEQIDRNGTIVPGDPSIDGNPNVVSLSLGLQYLFRLGF